MFPPTATHTEGTGASVRIGRAVSSLREPSAFSMTIVPSARRASGQTLIVLLGRFLQGLSAGAGIVVGRAIVRDLYADDEAQRALPPALCSLVMGLLGFACRLGFLVRLALHLRGARA